MKMIKSALGIAFFTVISRITGYCRDILMAKYMGTSIIMDTLVIAIKVPSFLRRIFAEGALNSSFIPIYTSLLVANEKKAKEFLDDILSLMLFILITVVIIFEIFMPSILSFILQNSQKDFINLAIFFSRLTFPFILLISLTALFSGVLNSFEKFSAAASSQIGGNCFIIFIMLLVNPQNLGQGTDVAVAITGSGVIQLLWVLVPCYIYGLKPRLKVFSVTPEIKRFSRRMLPAAFGAGILQLNLLVDMYIATLLPGGTNSYLYYADRLYQLPISVTGTAMGTVLLPLLTKLWRHNKAKEASYYQNRAIEFTLLICLPAIICLYFLSEPLVRISFEHGKFTHEATLAVTQTVLGFSTGLPAYVLARVFNSSFFSRQNTTIPTVVAVASMFVNLGLNLLLMKSFKHLGIALSTSLASWFNVFVLAFILYKRGEFSWDSKLLNFFPKAVLAWFITFFTTYMLIPYFSFYLNNQSLFRVIQGIIGILTLIGGLYFGIMHIFKSLRFREYTTEQDYGL